MKVGIEALNFYAGSACISVREIFQNRGLDLARFDNLMMNMKSIGLPCEDPVTNGVNAAMPIISNLTEDEKNSIELLITASESGIDFGKSLSTYIHKYLGLSNNCRLFEVKQACFGGTAALQMACCYIASSVSPGAKALVISSDVAWAAMKGAYGEPSQATGAAAMLVSTNPLVLEMDLGATGNYSYEVSDACRPLKETEVGDPDLSLLAYLECLQKSYEAYVNRVKGADFLGTFDYLAFHTPFAGMVKGGHRKMMRSLYHMSVAEIDNDFQKRVVPSLTYCTQVGNVYSATLFLALCGLIDSTKLASKKRIGMYSYGSGCCSEFYSGIIGPSSSAVMQKMNIGGELERRYYMSIDEYDKVLEQNMEWTFGVHGKEVDFSSIEKPYNHFFKGRSMLVLDRIDDGFCRKYIWS